MNLNIADCTTDTRKHQHCLLIDSIVNVTTEPVELRLLFKCLNVENKKTIHIYNSSTIIQGKFLG